MKYFKNIELAKVYHVSEKSVRNWIQAAQAGRLSLQLHEEKGRTYVANTTRNSMVIEELVKKGKKYKNSRGFKRISPRKEFYEVYAEKQIQDIISSLIVHKEIPLQYGYADGGADSWDKYANKLLDEDTSNILIETLNLLDLTQNNIGRILEDYPRVNVIDLGPGNGLPVRATLDRLIEEGRLGRYIAIDISQRMLNILEQNIKSWFGDKVVFEGHVRDLNYERFNDLLASDYMDGKVVSVNLVFFLGCTLNNFRVPDQSLLTINNSLGPNDVLLYNSYIDTPKSRRYFDLSGEDDKKDHQQSGLIPTLWGVDDSLCQIDQLFSEEDGCRLKIMRPKVDLSINFDLEQGSRHVDLRKGEPILLWRHRHYGMLELFNLFDKNNFEIVQGTKSKDQEYVLLAAKIKTNSI